MDTLWKCRCEHARSTTVSHSSMIAAFSLECPLAVGSMGVLTCYASISPFVLDGGPSQWAYSVRQRSLC